MPWAAAETPVLAVAPKARGTRPVPRNLPLGRWVGRPGVQVVAFIVLATAVKVVLALLQQPEAIEAYHWLYARHPAAGYFDHPGMIGWLVWLSTSVFGDSLLAIRLPTIVGGGLAVWLAFLAGRRMYDERAGRMAALLVGLVPLVARFSMEATPDGPLLLFWMASLWALSHALSKDGGGWWLAAGLFVGAAMDSKYTAVLLPAGLLLFLVFSPEHRAWLRRREPYLAALMALAVFSPTILWNSQNGWQSFTYQGVERLRSSDGFTLNYADLFVRRQLGLVTPIVLLWAVAAGARTFARWKSAPWCDRLNASLGLPMLGLFFVLSFFRSVRAHWAAPAYLGLFLLSASAVMRGGRWTKGLHYATLAILAAAGLALPLAVAVQPAESRKNWEFVSAEIRRLRPEFVITGDYHDAAQLAYHLRPVTAWDLTPAGLGGKSFHTWWRPEPFAGRDAIVVLEKPADAAQLEAVRQCFESLHGPADVEASSGGDRRQVLQVWTARGYRGPVRNRGIQRGTVRR